MPGTVNSRPFLPMGSPAIADGSIATGSHVTWQ
jgi:hypothetical protein